MSSVGADSVAEPSAFLQCFSFYLNREQMDSTQKPTQQFGSPLILALLAPLAGALARVVGTLFRIALERITSERNELALSVHFQSVPRSLLYVLLGVNDHVREGESTSQFKLG